MNPAFDLSVILPIFMQAVTYDVIDSGGGEHTEPIKRKRRNRLLKGVGDAFVTTCRKEFSFLWG